MVGLTSLNSSGARLPHKQTLAKAGAVLDLGPGGRSQQLPEQNKVLLFLSISSELSLISIKRVLNEMNELKEEFKRYFKRTQEVPV